MTTLQLAIDSRRAKQGADEFERSVGRVDKSAGLADRSVAKLVATIGGLAAAQRAVGVISRFETGLVGVAKTANLTDAELLDLEKSIVRMGAGMAVPIDSLLELAGVAGQLGVKGVADIAKFTETLAKLQGAAPSIAGEEAALALARLQAITGQSVDEIDNLASVIVFLGNELKTAENEIVRASTFIGQSAAAFGLTATEVVGLGGAVANLGQRAETAGTAIGRAFIEIDAATRNGGDSLRAFAEAAGTSAEDFAALFASDRLGALEAFVVGLGRINSEGGSAAAVLERVGLTGSENNKVFTTAAANAQEFSRALRLSSEEQARGTALNAEFARGADTLASSFGRARNALELYVNGLGGTSGLSGALREASDATGAAIRILGGFATEQDKASASAQTLAAAIEAGTVALTAFGAKKLITGVVGLGLEIRSVAASAVAAERASVALASSATITARQLGTVSIAGNASAASLGRARAAFVGLSAVIRANPIGVLVTALGAASVAMGVFRSRTAEANAEVAEQARSFRDVLDSVRSMEETIARARIAEDLGKPNAVVERMRAELRLVETAYIDLRQTIDENPLGVTGPELIPKSLQELQRSVDGLNLGPVARAGDVLYALRTRYDQLTDAIARQEEAQRRAENQDDRTVGTKVAATTAVERYIAGLQAEAIANGIGEQAANRLNTALRLLKASREDGIALTREQIVAAAQATRAIEEQGRRQAEAVRTLQDELRDYDFKRTIADSIGQGMLDAARDTENAGDIIRRTLEDIAAQILRFKVIQPIIGGLIGPAPGTQSSAGSGSGGFGVFGVDVASAKGNAWANGKTQRFDKGGMINRMTRFVTPSGARGSAGEGARAEAIMPLKRDGKGNLGVVVAGGGDQRPIVYNFNFPNARDPQDFRRSRRQVQRDAARIARESR